MHVFGKFAKILTLSAIIAASGSASAGNGDGVKPPNKLSSGHVYVPNSNGGGLRPPKKLSSQHDYVPHGNGGGLRPKDSKTTCNWSFIFAC